MSLKMQSIEHKSFIKDCISNTNEIARHWWEEYRNFYLDQKKVVDKDIMLIIMKIKETVHFVKNLSYFFTQILRGTSFNVDKLYLNIINVIA